MKTLQKLAGVHAAVHDLFNQERYIADRHLGLTAPSKRLLAGLRHPRIPAESEQWRGHTWHLVSAVEQKSTG